jgi:hypothetical protein
MPPQVAQDVPSENAEILRCHRGDYSAADFQS